LTKVVFDTRTKWTGVVMEDATGADNPSLYSPTSSSTVGTVFFPEKVNLRLDDVQFAADIFTDKMCLFNFGINQQFSKLCNDKQVFLGIDQVLGQFDAQGLIGLGPQDVEGHQSYVIDLHKSNQIPRPVVGLNYENNLYTDKVSTMTFGYFQDSSIEGGK
jgi:hypothetical protein